MKPIVLTIILVLVPLGAAEGHSKNEFDHHMELIQLEGKLFQLQTCNTVAVMRFLSKNQIDLLASFAAFSCADKPDPEGCGATFEKVAQDMAERMKPLERRLNSSECNSEK